VCKKYFPLSLLQQHVNSGCHQMKDDSADDSANDDMVVLV